MDKRSVSIKKLLIDCVRFWFLLVLFAGLGVFVGLRSTVSYNESITKQMQDDKQKQEEEEAAAEELAKDVVEDVTFTRKQCEKKLTGKALNDVLDAYHWYQDSQRRRDYLETSPYLQLNPYDVTATYLQFRVDYDGENMSDLDFRSYVHALKNYVTFNGLVDEFHMENDASARDLSELIAITDGGKDAYDRILMITIIHSPLTENLIDRVEKAFVAYGTSLTDTYPGFSVSLMSKYQANYYHGSLNSSIESQRNALSSDQTKIDTAVKKFTSMQKAYYNMQVNGTDEETVQEVVQEGTVTKKKAVTEIEYPSRRRIVPMMIVGGLAGVFVAVILLFFGNLLSGKFLFEKDYSGIYGIRSCGIVREKEKKGISGALQRAEYPKAEAADAPVFLYLQLKEAVKTAGEESDVYLIGSGKFAEMSGIQTLSAMAKKDGMRMHFKEEFLGDLAGAEEVLGKKTVFLVEQFHRSRLSKVDQIVDFCRENGVNPLGGICVDA
ncbi:MAG: hypothetical protein K5897_03560 [Eubacterium sp.]|nr:hypothetical protein [Eubacterium sp.]